MPLTAVGEFSELVVCSLKSWDNVWNRNNFFTDALIRRNPQLRVLYVEPPADPLFDLTQGRRPQLPHLQPGSAEGRLEVLRPVKVMPRKAGGWVDSSLGLQVRMAARKLRFARPVLWINDVTYAGMIARTNWPSLYDVSDDWLLAPFASREIERLRMLDQVALRHADEVVVCSQALAESRGALRDVTLIPNAVDAEHFRRPRSRPDDLPHKPVVVYAGTTHDARIDVPLVVDVARSLPQVRFVFVGPNALGRVSQRLLDGERNVLFLGPRPYDVLPAYLQHADAVFVPHLVSPFMESLDPIKAYECLAIDTPTVATAVPGFREQPAAFFIADREGFAAAVERAVTSSADRPRQEPPSWEERAARFECVLQRAFVGTSNAWRQG